MGVQVWYILSIRALVMEVLEAVDVVIITVAVEVEVTPVVVDHGMIRLMVVVEDHLTPDPTKTIRWAI